MAELGEPEPPSAAFASIELPAGDATAPALDPFDLAEDATPDEPSTTESSLSDPAKAAATAIEAVQLESAAAEPEAVKTADFQEEATAPAAAEADDELGLRIPEGFAITRYADDSLAHDIFSMTIDSLGRVVVSGPGYVKILVDTDN
ncbi:MAG: hypothetical protein ACM3U2_18235, partial [Deltaproteobacteria bacterium]